MVIYFLRTILQVVVMVEAWTRGGKSAGGRSRVLKRNYFSLEHININYRKYSSASVPRAVRRKRLDINNHSGLCVSDALADRSSCLYDRYRLWLTRNLSHHKSFPKEERVGLGF